MSSVKLLGRSASKWAVTRRSIHSTAVFRTTAEQETEAATQRKYMKDPQFKKANLTTIYFYQVLSAQ